MVRVVIPWKHPGDPDRQRALAWVRKQHAREGREVELDAPPYNVTWSKARAVTPVLERLPAGVVIVSDADVWSEGIASAVRAVTVGAAAWAIPHRRVFRLDRQGTELALGGRNGKQHLQRGAYDGLPGGGIVVAHRDTLLDTPLDPRFEGWGQEDESWGVALRTLHGQPWRGEADLIHLWHSNPAPDRLTRRYGSQASKRLFIQYATAQRSPARMREIIDAAKRNTTMEGEMPTAYAREFQIPEDTTLYLTRGRRTLELKKGTYTTNDEEEIRALRANASIEDIGVAGNGKLSRSKDEPKPRSSATTASRGEVDDRGGLD